MKIPRDRIVKQPVEESRFDGNASFSLGFINLDPTVKVHARSQQISYYWGPNLPSAGEAKDLQTQGFPLHVSSVPEAMWKEKKIHIEDSKCTFQQEEAHFLEAAILTS